MRPSSLFNMISAASAAIRSLEAAGVYIEVGEDFSVYREHRVRQTDRSQIYPMFDVSSSYIDETNGFWICGFDENSDLVHTQAVRLLDLSETSLARHLYSHRHKYITPNSTPDPDRTTFSGPASVDLISGKVCYHGEFWLQAQGLGGPRSLGMTAALSRLLLELMVAAWNPNFVFALVPKFLAMKGAHLRYGYYHCEPGRWIGPDQQVTEEDYLIWMSAADLATAFLASPEGMQENHKKRLTASNMATNKQPFEKQRVSA